MDIFVYMAILVLGTIVGSFLNVVIYRYGTGSSPMHGRSMCFSCGKTLRWYELLPLLSFLFQGGKCRGCRSTIAWQYPLVEVLTGLLFVLVFWRVTGGAEALLVETQMLPALLETLYLWVVASILMVISVYDVRHKIIPDSAVYSFAGISLLAALIYSFAPSVSAPIFLTGVVSSPLWWILAGPLLSAPFAFLWYVSGGRWMGFGDAKLALGIGWLLGLSAGISAIIIGFWAGAIVGLVLIALGKTARLLGLSTVLTMKSEIPFGPFLIFGTLLVALFGVDLFSLMII